MPLTEDFHGCTCCPINPSAPTPARAGQCRRERPCPEQTRTFPQSTPKSLTLRALQVLTPPCCPCPLPVPALPLLGIVDAWVAPPARQLSPCPQSCSALLAVPKALARLLPCASPRWGHPVPSGVTSLGGITRPQAPPPAQLCSPPEKKTSRIFPELLEEGRETFQPIKVPLQPPFSN